MAETKQKRCRVLVYKADVPRYTGGPLRFKMHYTKEECSRRADESGRCWQHKDQPWLEECCWAEEFIAAKPSAHALKKEEAMKHWLKVNLMFGVLELVQSLLLAWWVWQRVWFMAAIAAATFMGMLVIHVLSGMNMIASWLLMEFRQTTAGTKPTA